jgi:hypothetical protein
MVAMGMGTAGGAGTAPATTPGSYAILGLESVTIRSGVDVEPGDVGCNASNGSVTLMARARVASNVAGETLRLGSKANAGAFFCNKLEPTRATTATCSAMTTPLVDSATLPTVSAAPGNQDIRIPPRGTMTGVAPGAYGVLRVGEQGEVHLAGGEYDFRMVFLWGRARLFCDAACTIRVADTVTLRDVAQLGPIPPLDATAVRLEIRGGNRTHAAIRTYRRTMVDANVYAPNGGIVLGQSGRYTGAFIGKTVFVYQRSHIVGKNAF